MAKSAVAPDTIPIIPPAVTPTVAATATEVKTKVVSKTAMAVAVAFLGFAAIAAGMLTLPQSGPSGNNCFDSDYATKNDGGSSVLRYSFINQAIKGTAYGIQTNSTQFVSSTDKCWNDKKLLEFFCDVKNNKVTWNSFACAAGTSCVDGACVKPVPVYDETTVLKVQLPPPPIYSQIMTTGVAGDELSKVYLSSYQFSATGGDVLVKSVKLAPVVGDSNLTSLNDYDSIYLASNSVDIPNAVGIPTGSGEIVLQTTDFVVKPGTASSSPYSSLNVKAVLQPLKPSGGATSGHVIGYKIINPIEAVSLTTGKAVKVNFNDGGGVYHFLHKSRPVISNKPLASKKLTNGVNDLYKFSIKAESGDVGLYKVSFKMVYANVNVQSLQLFDVTDSNDGILIGELSKLGKLNDNGELWATSGTEWATNYPINEITIAKNQSRVFVLRANLTNVLNYYTTIVTSFIYQPADVVMDKPWTAAAGVNGYFVWSDKSSAAHSVNSNDWTDGTAVPGPVSLTTTLSS